MNMHTIYNKLILVMLAVVAVAFTACSDDDNTSGALLEAFGPSPTPRGGQITFIGKNLDRISTVVFPGDVDVTDIEVISSERIKVTVPQTAEVGYIRLLGTGIDLTTKTQITYTEPISITQISPSTVKPGETLTIEGDYLNLITRVIFTGEKEVDNGTPTRAVTITTVEVTSDDFITWERGKIELTVPLEAQSGPITLSNSAAMPIELESEAELDVVLPAVAEIVDLSDKKPGDEISITVEDINLVKAIELPNGETVEFTAEGNTLTFVLPEEVTDGVISLVPYSGVRVPVANLGMAVPTGLVASPATDIKAGDVITITGIDLNLVTTVSFANVEDEVELDSQSATEIKVTMPEMAQSGDLTLNTASGNTATVAIETLKPVVTSYSAATIPAGNDITLTGTNLTLITKVTFGGDKSVEVEPASATALTVTVPVTAETGNVVLTMKNEETVECPSLTVEKPVFCYIPELPGADVKILSGELWNITVENNDKLTGVEVEGQSVQYILQGKVLSLPIPAIANGDTDVTLISSNGSVTYTINVTLAGAVETVVMDEVRDLGNWASEANGGAFRLYKEDFEAAGVKAGSILKFYFTVSAVEGQIQLNDANWGAWTTLKFDDIDQTSYEYEIAQDFLTKIMTEDDGWSTSAIVVQGQNMVVSKVSVIVVN